MRIFSTMGFLSLAAGAAWGLANFWCLVRAVRCAMEGKRGWRLAGWVALKLFGVYGLAAWMLIGLRMPAAPWLAGFTLSLIVFAIARNAAVKQSQEARND